MEKTQGAASKMRTVMVVVSILTVMVTQEVIAETEVATSTVSALTTADVGCIEVAQEEMRFSQHAVTMASVAINCGGCSVSEVRLSCPGPDWTQELVDPSFLTLQGDGHSCLLAPGQILAPSSTTHFLYLHSPPLPLSPLSATFQC